MPIPFLYEAAVNGISWLPSYWDIAKISVLLVLIAAIKSYSRGAVNRAERKMHSKVVLITGGTSGIGAATALDLALRGAQIVLLTHYAKSDPFLVDYIDDLRERTGNQMIYAEQVDLSNLYSIRQFATKWIDNAPPRRLDMIILCAATHTPRGKSRFITSEGLEETWMVNYLANFHLLSILSPAIRAQPPDRDVRIVFTTCSSYISSPVIVTGAEALDVKSWSPATSFARSKLALMIFSQAFQKHLDAYKRPDGAPMNARVVLVDPGLTRTPGFRRWVTRGTLWGLGIYILLWHNAWLFVKGSQQGAQSVLFAAMEADLGRGAGGKLIKECKEVDIARLDVKDEEVARKLWQESEKLVERVEREEAVKRAFEKQAKTGDEKKTKEFEAESDNWKGKEEKSGLKRSKKTA